MRLYPTTTKIQSIFPSSVSPQQSPPKRSSAQIRIFPTPELFSKVRRSTRKPVSKADGRLAKIGWVTGTSWPHAPGRGARSFCRLCSEILDIRDYCGIGLPRERLISGGRLQPMPIKSNLTSTLFLVLGFMRIMVGCRLSAVGTRFARAHREFMSLVVVCWSGSTGSSNKDLTTQDHELMIQERRGGTLL